MVKSYKNPAFHSRGRKVRLLESGPRIARRRRARASTKAVAEHFDDDLRRRPAREGGVGWPAFKLAVEPRHLRRWLSGIRKLLKTAFISDTGPHRDDGTVQVRGCGRPLPAENQDQPQRLPQCVIHPHLLGNRRRRRRDVL